MNSNRQSGKINILALASIAIVGMIAASLVFAKEDPASVGVQFMDALSKQNVDKLTELSYIDKTDPASVEEEKKRLREQWDFCVNKAGKHYMFLWNVTGATTTSTGQASVVVMMNKGGPNGYDEKYQLPMEKANDKWKVDVRSMSKTMFPALPQ